MLPALQQLHGQPACCAAAVETLKIFADDNVRTQPVLSEHMGALTRRGGSSACSEVRQRDILAIENGP